jgi:hypothetical protein
MASCVTATLMDACFQGACNASTGMCVCEPGYVWDETFFADSGCTLPSEALLGYFVGYSVLNIAAFWLLARRKRLADAAPKMDLWKRGLIALAVCQVLVILLFAEGGMGPACSILWGLANAAFLQWSHSLLMSVLVPLHLVLHKLLNKQVPERVAVIIALSNLVCAAGMAATRANDTLEAFNTACVVALIINVIGNWLMSAYVVRTSSLLLRQVRKQLEVRDQGYSATLERHNLSFLALRLNRVRFMFVCFALSQLVLLMWVGIRLALHTTPYMYVANFALVYLSIPIVVFVCSFFMVAKPPPFVDAEKEAPPTHTSLPVVQVHIRRSYHGDDDEN